MPRQPKRERYDLRNGPVFLSCIDRAKKHRLTTNSRAAEFSVISVMRPRTSITGLFFHKRPCGWQKVPAAIRQESLVVRRRAAAATVLSDKRTVSGHPATVRQYWTENGNSDKMIIGRKDGHL